MRVRPLIFVFAVLTAVLVHYVTNDIDKNRKFLDLCDDVNEANEFLARKPGPPCPKCHSITAVVPIIYRFRAGWKYGGLSLGYDEHKDYVYCRTFLSIEHPEQWFCLNCHMPFFNQKTGDPIYLWDQQRNRKLSDFYISIGETEAANELLARKLGPPCPKCHSIKAVVPIVYRYRAGWTHGEPGDSGYTYKDAFYCDTFFSMKHPEQWYCIDCHMPFFNQKTGDPIYNLRPERTEKG